MITSACLVLAPAGSTDRSSYRPGQWPDAKPSGSEPRPCCAGANVHRVPVDEVIVELDVFHGALDGLVVAEVEFEDLDAMTAFVAPDWFGPELTDDRRYTNAALAVDGRPSA